MTCSGKARAIDHRAFPYYWYARCRVDISTSQPYLKLANQRAPTTVYPQNIMKYYNRYDFSFLEFPTIAEKLSTKPSFVEVYRFWVITFLTRHTSSSAKPSLFQLVHDQVNIITRRTLGILAQEWMENRQFLYFRNNIFSYIPEFFTGFLNCIRKVIIEEQFFIITNTI